MLRFVRFGLAAVLLVAVTSAIAFRFIAPERPASERERLIPLVASADGIVAKWSAALGQSVIPGEALVRLDSESVARELNEASAPSLPSDPIAIVPMGLESLPRLSGGVPVAPPSVAAPVAAPKETPASRDFDSEITAIDKQIAEAETRLVAAREQEENVKRELAEAEAALPELAETLKLAEAKRDKNSQLYDLGAVSRKAAEKAEQAASEAQGSLSSAQGKVALLQSAVEVASANTVKLAREAADLQDRRTALFRERDTMLATVVVPPQQPTQAPAARTVPSMPRAPVAPPVPVVVLVDEPALELAESGELAARQRLESAKKAYDDLTIRSLEKGVLAAIDKPAGSPVRKGDILGWVRPSR